ncbi:MAG: hypothetical protein M0Q24_11540, partial [Sulfurimonas sp.]|uniref:hypothetical protein n=1 Tax=Sulfurimonas sp. TaxID=2022749 RepID=UPI0025D55C53
MVYVPPKAPPNIVLTKAPINGPITGRVTNVYSPGGSPVIPIQKRVEIVSERPTLIPPKAPANIVLTKAPTNGPITGRTISIQAPAGAKVIVPKQVDITSTPPKTVIPEQKKLVLTKAPTNGPIVGETLKNQGLRTFGGKVVSEYDLKTISFSDVLKKDAEIRAAKGDIISALYLAADDPKVVMSPAWMEKKIGEVMKSVGLDPETQYGKPGGPTVGDWRGDVLVEATKGATLDFIPGTARGVVAGLQYFNLIKDVPVADANEVLESVKGGAGELVTTMIDSATVNPARFAGAMIPGLILGKAISPKIPKPTIVKGGGAKVVGGKPVAVIGDLGKSVSTKMGDIS